MRKLSLVEVKAHLEYISRSFSGDTLKLMLYLYAETHLVGKTRTSALKRDEIAAELGRSTDSVKKCSSRLVEARHLKVQKVRPRSHSSYYKIILPKPDDKAKSASTTPEERKAWLAEQKKMFGVKRKLNIFK